MATEETTVTLSEVEIKLIFNAEKGYPATWGYSGGSPGAPDCWYSEALVEYGVEVPRHREVRMLKYYEDEIEQAMVDHLTGLQADKDDHTYEQMKDRMTFFEDCKRRYYQPPRR